MLGRPNAGGIGPEVLLVTYPRRATLLRRAWSLISRGVGRYNNDGSWMMSWNLKGFRGSEALNQRPYVRHLRLLVGTI